MDLYAKQLTKAKKQKSDIQNDVDTLIMFESANITDKVKKRWSWGRGVNGGEIGQYSKSKLGQSYRAFKLNKNPKALGTVDLILTGSLSNKLKIRKMGSLFEVVSLDQKFKKIGDKYGFEQFNLTAEETQQLILEIYEKILTNYTYEVWTNV
jgi:hypothetical protein